MTPVSHTFASDSLPMERVPEHGIAMMEAFSNGQSADIGPYRFYHGQDWLMAIGYPLWGPFTEEGFTQALQMAQTRFAASACFAIAPRLPEKHMRHLTEKDRFHVLSSQAPIPARLANPVKRAASALSVRLETGFTAAHRRLWGEFLGANAQRMTSRVASLYAKTPEAMAAAPSLRLLSAYTQNNELAAALLLDLQPANFISYIIGAHSRVNYTPHATDLLFAEMLKLARAENKAFIHLGLGVNDGISRFKQKWGAKPGLPYLLAQWEESQEQPEERVSLALARAILNAPQVSRAQLLQNEPSERPFAMLWRVEKDSKVSWLGGTAHFFCHSFASSLRSLYRKVDTVVFEGPLDAQFMAEVDAAGKKLPAGFRPLISMLSDDEIRRLEKTVAGPRGFAARLMGLEKPMRMDLRWLLANGLPWYAFFTIWTTFLERQGWSQSVDMEAWRIAMDMGLKVAAMENLDEQLESLGSLPPKRVLDFFRQPGAWKKRARQNVRAYLAGDLEKMMGTSAEFPTRTEHIVGRRDQRFRERMRPYLEKGGAAVFVGCAHLVNLRHMLREDGFTVQHSPLGVWPRLCKHWRRWTRPGEEVKW